MLSKTDLQAELRRRREAVLVVNTASRRGERSFSVARAGLEKRGIRVVESYPVRTPSQLPKIVERAVGAGHRLVVVGGGDGTISSVVGVFAYADTALGLLPLGTGNSFAQTLTVPQRLDAALDVIANGKVVDVDLGVVNGAYFANTATIGLSADVARGTPTWLKRLLGPVSYLLTGTAQTFVHAAFRATVESDAQPHAFETHQMIVANGHIFGASPVLPYAHVDNRSLAIVTLRGKSRWSVARMWLALLSGRLHRLRDASGLMRRECTIETDPVQFVDVDGEVITQTPARFSLAGEALRVMVPESFDEPWD